MDRTRAGIQYAMKGLAHFAGAECERRAMNPPSRLLKNPRSVYSLVIPAQAGIQ